jgi:AcrR family transcriptional regulator
MMNEIAVRPIPTRAELTRERILEVAEVVFARHGLNGTRMREIAETAQVNKATIYSYFPSKAELHEAVLERGIQPMIDLLAGFSAGPRTMATAQEFVRAGMKHLSERPNLSRLIYLEIISEGSYLRELSQRWLRPLLDRALAELKGSTASTPWEGDLTPLVVTAFMQLSFGHFALAPLFREAFGEDPTSVEWVANQTRFMVALMDQMFPERAERTEREAAEENSQR